VVTTFAALVWSAATTDWRALFQDEESKEKRKKHDSELFDRLDHVLPEWRVVQMDDSISGHQMFWQDDSSACSDLIALVRHEGNLFMDSELRSKMLAFTGALKAIKLYTATHFFYTADRFELYPELGRRLEIGDSEGFEKWEAHASEVSRLCRTMRGNYSAYRRCVKERLFR
jgi:hypothetical protein